MTTLADRIEVLAGPDREVDFEILASQGWVLEKRGKDRQEWWYRGDDNRRYSKYPYAYGSDTAIRYTGSIDAAMTLAGDDWQEILHTALERMYLFHAAEATPTDLARFISAAALRARAE